MNCMPALTSWCLAAKTHTFELQYLETFFKFGVCAGLDAAGCAHAWDCSRADSSGLHVMQEEAEENCGLNYLKSSGLSLRVASHLITFGYMFVSAKQPEVQGSLHPLRCCSV